MKLGYIGLGKMGFNMVLRLKENGIDVVAWNRSSKPREEIAKHNVEVADTIEDLVNRLERPRNIWIMVTAGDPVDEVVSSLEKLLDKGDLIIDGGNSYYKDSVKRYKKLGRRGIHFVDAGVSGGPKGARLGTSIMVGGDREDFDRIKPVLKAAAAKDAYGYFGESGAGHFVKMVHNGIEYGMMQAIAEGVAVLKASEYEFDLVEAMRVYNRCTVIESRLIGWAHEALEKDQELKDISDQIDYSGEGEWTIKEAKRLGVGVPVIEKAFAVRVESKSQKVDPKNSFRNKVVSALRGEFGGHYVKKT